MSVRRLLAEMDSYELSAWREFLKAQHEHMEESREAAAEEERLTRGRSHHA